MRTALPVRMGYGRCPPSARRFAHPERMFEVLRVVEISGSSNSRGLDVSQSETLRSVHVRARRHRLRVMGNGSEGARL